ncbi:hypothetical protein RSAG8_09826, partial [Rhizoctonia solani AG-8 WAC10335]
MLTEGAKEWAIESILQHTGKGKEMSFKQLEALEDYLELQGVDIILSLKWTTEYGDYEWEFRLDSEDEEGHGEDTVKVEDRTSTKVQPHTEVNAIELNLDFDPLEYLLFMLPN